MNILEYRRLLSLGQPPWADRSARLLPGPARDYLSNWVGEHGWVIHSDIKYTGPAHTGDATYIDGEVTGVDHTRPDGPVANVAVRMTTQSYVLMAKGDAQVQLPTP